MQTLARRGDVGELTAGYGLVVADECHDVPAAAFEDAVRQIPARRWLGLTATPYRRDKLDGLTAWQVGQIRHTISLPLERAPDVGREELPLPGITGPGIVARPRPVLHVHPTAYCYGGDADRQAPVGMAAIYRDLAADEQRTRQITADVAEAVARGRHCLVLTQSPSCTTSLMSCARWVTTRSCCAAGRVPGPALRPCPACSRSLAARPCWSLSVSEDEVARRFAER